MADEQTAVCAWHTSDNFSAEVLDRAAPSLAGETGRNSDIHQDSRAACAPLAAPAVRTLARVLEPSDLAHERVERAMFVRAGAGGGPGGDFCDVFALDGSAVALVVGDVCGRGEAAGVQVPEVRAMLRLLLYDDPDPARALSRLSGALCLSAADDDSLSSFVRASVAVLYPAEEMAIFACAGSEPPMIVSTKAVHRRVPVGGLPLGIFEDARYAAVQLPLTHTDLVLMVTDGILDSGRPHRPLGAERLLKWLNGLVPLGSLPVIGQMLMDEVESYAGGLIDDCALLLARVV